MPKLFEIWCEGDPRRDYTACHLGYGKGASLIEACEELSTKSEYFNTHYNPSTMMYKGCKVFENEEEARVSYGQSMPIKPGENETQDEFISRCIGEEVGNGHEQAQAVAICYSKWKERRRKELDNI